jgi:hypothetical protein
MRSGNERADELLATHHGKTSLLFNNVTQRAEFQDQRVLIQFFVETPLQFVEDGS